MSIVVKDSVVKFGDTKIIQIEHIEIKSKTMTAIIGMNGSGKTTLLKTLLNLEGKHQKTHVLYNDQNIKKMSAKKLSSLVAYVSQKEVIEYDFSVEDVIKMGGYRLNTDNKVLFKQIVDAFKLESLLEKSIKILSGGEFQRVQIARAVYQETPFLILDEPTAALDVAHTIEVFRYLKHCVETLGKSVILVSHELDQVMRYCDDVIILSSGSVACSGSVETVINSENLNAFFNYKAKIVSYGNIKRIIEKA